ncbi:MAG: hypothetical protein EU539_05585 [Promethearchaeota archaeon]|nr:MAG: hypothetical protein EU539_05585 [Candidatus Lokiarchaeota archaeon]
MECQKVSNNFVHSELYIDPVLEEVLIDPCQYKIDEMERAHVDSGDYLNLRNKCLWLVFYFEHQARCRIAAYIQDGFFVIWSMVSTPQRKGVGSRTLKLLNQKFKEKECELGIRVVDVWPSAKLFWKKMKKRDLITGFKEYKT